MTTTDFSTTTPRVILPPFDSAILPDLKANIAQAQAVGDLAERQAAAAGLSNEDRADTYHLAFVATMRDLGTPIPCGCPRCA
jgi:hypothetical protein